MKRGLSEVEAKGRRVNFQACAKATGNAIENVFVVLQIGGNCTEGLVVNDALKVIDLMLVALRVG